jgi:hypothetical protein
MKKLLVAAIMLAGLSAFAPQAEARHYRGRYVRYYDYCDRPSYRYGYRDNCYYDEPRYYSYYRPVRSYYRSYDYGGPRVRAYYARPRFSFFFGF